MLWLRVHNGRDGDEWPSNNAPGYRVRRMPLTLERAALIADLRAEYELDSRLERGFTAETPAVFIAAGWSAIENQMALNGSRIEAPRTFSCCRPTLPSSGVTSAGTKTPTQPRPAVLTR